ncbi:MAG: DUF4190 domain-containing protein [Porphyromonadaceae bacterium]|nr:MAG: DUF4190 domain-containing protein [Porphyromonadaceae bacterium]
MEVINPAGTLICPRCGHPNDERAFFCSNCGAPIGSKAGRTTGNRTDFQQYRYYSDPDRRSYYYDGLPLISLLVTIVGFFAAGFLGPLFGVILAHVSLRRLNRRGDYSNRGLAIVSLVIGYFMLIIGLIIMIAFGVFVGAALFNHGWGNGHWNYL